MPWIKTAVAGQEHDRSRGSTFKLGKCKQKKAAMERWTFGIHQIMVWFGTARKGAGAAARANARPRARARARANPEAVAEPLVNSHGSGTAEVARKQLSRSCGMCSQFGSSCGRRSPLTRSRGSRS